MDHDAATLRAMASRTRAEAEQATESELRQAYLEAAADYERLADKLETLAPLARA